MGNRRQNGDSIDRTIGKKQLKEITSSYTLHPPPDCLPSPSRKNPHQNTPHTGLPDLHRAGRGGHGQNAEGRSPKGTTKRLIFFREGRLSLAFEECTTRLENQALRRAVRWADYFGLDFLASFLVKQKGRTTLHYIFTTLFLMHILRMACIHHSNGFSVEGVGKVPSVSVGHVIAFPTSNSWLSPH